MECNKDEAIRAKDLAEKKMQSSDFEGARKMALKARQLFPDLENIFQLLTVCDVHCSAQNRIGHEKDWYGILQVDMTADELTIKKQYRKLALALHPDKNKFPGAESAFKLIGEANLVLSDTRRRYTYDSKYSVLSKTAPSKLQPQVNFTTKHGIQNNIRNGFGSGFSGLNQHQTKQSGELGTFLTSCPFCSIRYQYNKGFVNRALRCPNCSKHFIAYELGWGQPGFQGAPPAFNRTHPSVSQQREVPQRGTFKTDVRTVHGFASHPGSKSSSPTIVGLKFASQPEGSSEVCKNSNTKEKEDGKGSPAGSKEGGFKVLNDDASNLKESGVARNRSNKRVRKQVVESSESSDGEDMGIEENDEYPASGLDYPLNPRRSLRQKQHVSYKENDDDDDEVASLPKRPKGSSSSVDNQKGRKVDSSSDDPKYGGVSSFFATSDISKGKNEASQQDPVAGNYQVNGQEKASRPAGAQNVEVIIDSGPDSKSINGSNLISVDCPDPEFNDFDSTREESIFAVDQIWACYDTVDGMPRFYCQIKKVFAAGFKLRLIWLEADPDDEGEINWVDRDLPVGCGKFRGGCPEVTSDRLTFSHQVGCQKRSNCSFVILPQKGEVWAVFKDWNINWSFDPEKHRKFKYEIVEIVSDFVEEAGIGVAYLNKLRGFVSLFQRVSKEVLISSNELYRFSHRVPAFRMTGNEGEGVPEGSFELDPASLPINADDLCYINEVNAGGMDSKMENLHEQFAEEKDKHMGLENGSTPKKSVVGHNESEGDAAKLRVNTGGCSLPDGTVIVNDISLPEVKDPSCRADEEESSMLTKDKSPKSSARNSSNFSSHFPACKLRGEVFHKFSDDKTEGKFELGQIWALYDENDRFPRRYGVIKKIETAPFLLSTVLLEPFPLRKESVQQAYGTFRLHSRRTECHTPDSFSHLLKVASVEGKKVEIYPREGEVWALHKNWSAESSGSELSDEYEIVEVLESSERCLKVCTLMRVSGFRSVFRCPRTQRASSLVWEIRKDELARFSHQVPAFQLKEEKNGHLRGCWELDPASLPASLFEVKHGMTGKSII